MKLMLTIISIMALSSMAFATGIIDCKGENSDVKFNFGISTGMGFGAPIVGAQGNLEYKKMTGTRDIMIAEYSSSSVVNYWNEASGVTKLNLFFEAGTEDFLGEIQATLIVDPADSNGESKGTLKILKIINGVDSRSRETKNELEVKCTKG